MKILSSMTNVIKTGLIAAIVLSTGAFQLQGNAKAISLSGPQDCDSNAVIYCGAQSTGDLITKYTNGTAQNSAKSIHDIYAKFGISAAEVQAMNSTAVAGTVTKGGDVTVGGKVVAKNALTAGRENIAGSTAVTYNGTSFYTRAPGVSFNSASIPAYIVMSNGVFQYAVIESCANPVTATPTTTPPPPPAPESPDYTVVKTVALKGSTNFQDTISNLKAGDHVVYRIVVKSTGKVAAKNILVKDTLPAHITFVGGTLTREGVGISSANFFTDGVTLLNLEPNASNTFQFEAVVGTADVGTPCTNETLTNTAAIKAPELPAKSDTAIVNTVCQPVRQATAPTCDNFNIVAGDNRTIRVTEFKATANDATFVNAVINWDVNKTNTSTAAITDYNAVVGQTHQYSADGTYLIAVTVNYTLDGKAVAVSGVQCQKQIAFTTKETPVITTPAKPAAPVALVNTGPGTTAGLFAVVTAVAVIGYQWTLRRRLSL